MNAVYDIYKLDTDGIRSDILTRYTVLDGQLNRSKNSQFTISGVCITDVPLKLGDRIAIARDCTQIFSGVVTDLTTSCDDCANNIKSWEAQVEGDAVVLTWRYAFAASAGAEPAEIEVAEDVYDKRPNNNNENSTQSALNRMLYYIRKHAGQNAHESRRLVTVAEGDDNTRGTQGRSAYHIKRLSDLVSEIGDPDELYPLVTTNSSGTRVLTVPDTRDRTGSVVVAPEFGNVEAWSVEQRYPEFNACWVISGVCEEDNGDDTTETRVWVYAEDEASIEQYGRIETVITKGDIKIVLEDPEDPEVIPVTEKEVRKLLEAEARARLQEAAATEKWTITMIETESCKFMTDWQLGDLVKCVINGTSFNAVIETVAINYAAGVETVTPTIGEVENGLYGDLLKTIHGIDRRLKTEEEK